MRHFCTNSNIGAGAMKGHFPFCMALCAMLLIFTTPVRAQNAFWVSTAGNDANVCNQTAPCRTFQGAIDKGSVAQINCLGSGNYGTVIITASITIDCGNGNLGSIVSAVFAIQIEAASAVNVVLRHLSLNGLDTADRGIITTGSFAGSLTLENCTVQRYKQAGIFFTAGSGRGTLQVSDSQIINSGYGIMAGPSNGQIASVILNRVELSGHSNRGLELQGDGVVAGTMRDSVVASNALDGIRLIAHQIFFTIESSSIIANLATGIYANARGASLDVTASTISGNGTGINANAGSIVSFGNNVLNGNGTDGAFTGTEMLR
jgi:hypothetical protein